MDDNPSASPGAMAQRDPTQPPRHPVGEVVEQLESLAGDSDVTLGRVVESFGRSSFLAVLLVPSLLVVSPLSGVPLFSSVCGISIVFITTQILLRRDHLWLPERLKRLHVSGERLHAATGRLKSIANWLDSHSRPRLRYLISPPMSVFALTICLIAGAMMPVLELVPFSSSLLGAMVSLIAVGLLVGDGIFVACGFIFGVVASSVPIFVLNAIFGR